MAMTAGRNRLGAAIGYGTRVAFVVLALFGGTASAVHALEVIDSSGGTIYLEVNKGRLLRLDEVPATVFLANPAVADLQFKSSRLVYLFGKATGETSLFALDKKDEILLNRKIVVGYDLDQMNSAIESILPGSGVTASMANSTLVLDGVVSSPAQAAQIQQIADTFTQGAPVLNRIKVAMPNQINLRVKVAEVARNVTKEFGFDYNVSGGGFSFSTALTTATGTASAGLTKTVGSLNIDAMLTALETEGLVTVLAEPSLTALNGQTASFLAGGEIPFGTTDKDGNTTITFKPFGVSLSFTPTLLDGSRISLKVTPEVSQLTGFTATVGGNTVRGLSTRRADTTVELGNGESLVLGGLLQRNVDEAISKVPGLGDIPILGALFRSEKYNRQETELMIVVTPYIVRPTEQRIALPTDGFRSPNDYARVGWGAMYRDSSGPAIERIARESGQQLIGPVGFQVE